MDTNSQGLIVTSCVEKLIDYYPNLKKLTLGGILITSSRFRQIRNGLTKLEVLKVNLGDVQDELTVDGVNYREMREIVELVIRFNIFDFSNETRRKLKGIFGDKLCRMEITTACW